MTPRARTRIFALLLAAAGQAAVAAPAGSGLRPAGDRRFEPVLVAAMDTTSIERGQGALLRLPNPAATLFVADPEIADYQTKSAALVYVYGKAIGETVLYAVDAAGRVMYASKLRITPNLGSLRDALHRHLPNDAISVEAVAGSITLTGTVLSAGHAADAMANE